MSFQINETCSGCSACVRLCPTEAIAGEKKQRHAIDTVLCSECDACGRFSPEGSLLYRLGQPRQLVKRSAWPKPALDKKKCSSCGICIDACPVSCLALSGAGGNGVHPYPYLQDAKACIACTFCAADCSTDAIRMV